MMLFENGTKTRGIISEFWVRENLATKQKTKIVIVVKILK